MSAAGRGGHPQPVQRQLEGCFGETLARFRPAPNLAALLSADWAENSDFMSVGAVPADWRHRRSAVRVSIEGFQPFLDVEHVDTLQFLRHELVTPLAILGLADLDTSTVRGPDRRVTRTIAEWAYSARDPLYPGEPAYAGIRYTSRLNSDWECWAVFEGTPMTTLTVEPLLLSNPHLQRVAARFGLVVH